jgi:hypothetical protein
MRVARRPCSGQLPWDFASGTSGRIYPGTNGHGATEMRTRKRMAESEPTCCMSAAWPVGRTGRSQQRTKGNRACEVDNCLRTCTIGPDQERN